MNCKCGVQSKRRCESHESCVCIVGFPACGCQKKSVVYETESRHAAVPPLLILGKKHRERKREIKLYFSTVNIIIITKADSHICRCYSTTNNQDIHSDIMRERI